MHIGIHQVIIQLPNVSSAFNANCLSVSPRAHQNRPIWIQPDHSVVNRDVMECRRLLVEKKDVWGPDGTHSVSFEVDNALRRGVVGFQSGVLPELTEEHRHGEILGIRRRLIVTV